MSTAACRCGLAPGLWASQHEGFTASLLHWPQASPEETPTEGGRLQRRRGFLSMQGSFRVKTPLDVWVDGALCQCAEPTGPEATFSAGAPDACEALLSTGHSPLPSTAGGPAPCGSLLLPVACP